MNKAIFILFLLSTTVLSVSAQDLGLITLDKDTVISKDKSSETADNEVLVKDKIPVIRDIEKENNQKTLENKKEENEVKTEENQVIEPVKDEAAGKDNIDNNTVKNDTNTSEEIKESQSAAEAPKDIEPQKAEEINKSPEVKEVSDEQPAPQENNIIKEEKPVETNKKSRSETSIIDLNKEVCPEQAPETSIIDPKKELKKANTNVELDEIKLLPAIEQKKTPDNEVKVNEEIKNDNPKLQEVTEAPAQAKSNEEEIKLKEDTEQRAPQEAEEIKPANAAEEQATEDKQAPVSDKNKETKEDSAKEASAPIWSEENKAEFVEIFSTEIDNKAEKEISKTEQTIETHLNSAIMF